MAKVIKVEHLSKAYQLGDFGTGTISRDLERFWASLRSKEDPFLKIGEVNDRTQKGGSDIVWSLNDLNFEIEQGDTAGIILLFYYRASIYLIRLKKSFVYTV